MSHKTIKKVLKDFGLTENAIEVYLLLAKHGTLRGGEIAKQTKIDRSLVYRILKRLKGKGLVDPTLESRRSLGEGNMKKQRPFAVTATNGCSR